MPTALEFRDVDILFCPGEGRKHDTRMAAALKRLDEGATRTQLSEELGVVLGVTGATLAVEQGKISVLMGLSGSGKSTLLRAANGLNRVTRGHVLVRDGLGSKDIAACDEGVLRHIRRRRIAMVFQQFALLPWRTVRENVAFGLELRGDPRAEIARIVDERLALVGLDQWADRYASELSGGMQQRVGLARAFATDADILLMDEPFSALDPLIRSKLQDELLMLQEKVQKTILFVSHDLDEALKIGDQVTILESGRIIQSGTGEDIVLRPATDYVAQFVAHMNPLSVMTGETVMRPLAALAGDAGGLRIDEAGRYRLQPASGAVHLDGAVHATTHLDDPEAHDTLPDGVISAPVDISVKALIRICAASDHPVLLMGPDGVAGVCGGKDLLRALSGRKG
jgi:glycine betaine/proline transport system ATP-binding protein